MKAAFYAIADFFTAIFEIIETLGNTVNYFFIGIIFVFLVVWTAKMIKHRKEGKEHASS